MQTVNEIYYLEKFKNFENAFLMLDLDFANNNISAEKYNKIHKNLIKMFTEYKNLKN